jgi:hypothetical protein
MTIMLKSPYNNSWRNTESIGKTQNIIAAKMALALLP